MRISGDRVPEDSPWFRQTRHFAMTAPTPAGASTTCRKSMSGDPYGLVARGIVDSSW